MKYPLLAIVGVHTEWGPDAAGATSDDSPQGEPRRGQAAAPLAFYGGTSFDFAPRRALRRVPFPALKIRGIDADSVLDSRVKGLTAITPAAYGDCGAADEDTAALFHVCAASCV